MAETIKMRGRLLLFDVIDDLGYKIPKDCELTYPEKVPVCYMFSYYDPEKVWGSAIISKDEAGLICEADITIPLDLDTFRDEYNNELPIGGYYKNQKSHYEDSIRVFDALKLVGIGITWAPASKEYKMVLVEESK